MFLFGLMSVIQITILPGVLILKAFNIKRGIVQRLVFSFALSLIANHLIVFAITAIGLDISITYYVIFAIELILLILLYISALKNPIGRSIHGKVSDISNYLSSISVIQKEDRQNSLEKSVRGILTGTLIVLALSSIWWAFKVWYTNIDSVFTQWDAIVSWNRWATEWFSGTFPTHTKRYAQLIPTNFAVSYAFIRSTQIQFFAKSYMPLFNLFILLLMFELGVETKNVGYFAGVVATRYIMKKFLGNYISSGYVDVALAFFAFITVYTLLKAKNNSSPKQRLNYLGLGGIFAAGAALTKQNGILIFVIYPIIAYAIILHNSDILSRKEKLLYIGKWFGISLCIILPWYIFNEYRILTGINDTNIFFLAVDRHEGRNLLERFIRATGLLEEYVYLYPFILLLLPFLDSAIVWISLTILIPYSLIWAFAFSTFPRNLSIALPLLGLVTGMGIQKIIGFGEKLIVKAKIEQIKVFIFAIIVIVAIISASLYVADSALVEHQEEQQKDILLSSINHKIYDYFEERGEFKPIMTNYPIQYLPGMEELQINIGNFADYDFYHWVIENHPEARLMLVFEDRADDQVLEEIENELENGNFELIFEDGKYMFIEIKR